MSNFAQIASDHDSSSEYEYNGPPIKSVRVSGRKRKQTQRFEAGPAKRGEATHKKRQPKAKRQAKRQAKAKAKRQATSKKQANSAQSSSSSSEDDPDDTSHNGDTSNKTHLSQFLTNSSTTYDEPQTPQPPQTPQTPQTPEQSEPPPEQSEPPPEQSLWVMQTLPTFAEKYPRLHAQTTGAITASLGAEIYALVKDQVTCIDMWSRPSNIARYYLEMISQIRVDNDLQPIPNISSIVEEVKAKWYGSYIASPQCSDHALLNTYQAIANAMEVQPASPTQTCEEIFQECYDTTKSEAFRQAVEKVVNDPQPLLYAIRMWQQHKGSDNMKNFLIKYSHALYNCRMKQMNINIHF